MAPYLLMLLDVAMITRDAKKLRPKNLTTGDATPMTVAAVALALTLRTGSVVSVMCPVVRIMATGTVVVVRLSN
ncbi:hypothetical protein DM860_009779 [Cuscuta australis]|uniref:Uncharacterized protein n=1 Tax=Cuscuta australis TaxID=267555 RepID=A0A328DB08_9ASTE|nr:hypothetical protein DM860_009779 [Cuscuta australis]